MNKTRSLPSGAHSPGTTQGYLLVTKICRVTRNGSCARKFSRQIGMRMERRNPFLTPYEACEGQRQWDIEERPLLGACSSEWRAAGQAHNSQRK